MLQAPLVRFFGFSVGDWAVKPLSEFENQEASFLPFKIDRDTEYVVLVTKGADGNDDKRYTTLAEVVCDCLHSHGLQDVQLQPRTSRDESGEETERLFRYVGTPVSSKGLRSQPQR